MGWNKNRTQYKYAEGTLWAIARWYEDIENLYPCVMMMGDNKITNPWVLAELKADFDMALSAIGRKRWKGIVSNDIGDYREYGKQQQSIIAIMIRFTDRRLAGRGFYRIEQLRGNAWGRMLVFLNEKSIVQTSPRS